MAGKGNVANVKKIIALLKMVLLNLKMMAGNDTDTFRPFLNIGEPV